LTEQFQGTGYARVGTDLASPGTVFRSQTDLVTMRIGKNIVALGAMMLAAGRSVQ
jgi:hypothetical protein